MLTQTSLIYKSCLSKRASSDEELGLTDYFHSHIMSSTKACKLCMILVEFVFTFLINFNQVFMFSV